MLREANKGWLDHIWEPCLKHLHGTKALSNHAVDLSLDLNRDLIRLYQGHNVSIFYSLTNFRSPFDNRSLEKAKDNQSVSLNTHSPRLISPEIFLWKMGGQRTHLCDRIAHGRYFHGFLFKERHRCGSDASCAPSCDDSGSSTASAPLYRALRRGSAQRKGHF